MTSIGVLLDQSAFGKAHQRASSDNKVIKYAHVDERQGLLQRLRDQLVGAAGFRHAGGMVVGEDRGGGVVCLGCLDDLTRIHARLGQSAAEQLVAGDHAVL